MSLPSLAFRFFSLFAPHFFFFLFTLMPLTNTLANLAFTLHRYRWRQLCWSMVEKMVKREREREKSSPRGRNRGLVERDETARRSKGVVRWKGSVGRRFHFVSLPACGGAIAAALCQSVTLSRHPFYYLARGCPTPLSIRSAPPPSLLHPVRATGTTWIKPGVA